MPVYEKNLKDYKKVLEDLLSNSPSCSAQLEMYYEPKIKQAGFVSSKPALAINCENENQRNEILSYLGKCCTCSPSGSNQKRFYIFELDNALNNLNNELEPEIDLGARTQLHGFNVSHEEYGYKFKDLTGNQDWVKSISDWTSEKPDSPKVMSRGSSSRELILLDLYDDYWNRLYNEHISIHTPQNIHIVIDTARKLLDLNNGKYVIEPEQKNKSVLLSEIVKQGKGVCRHHAPVCAYFLTRLVQDQKLTDGEIYHVRSNIDNKGGHTVTLYIPKNKDACWYFDSYNEKQAYNLIDPSDKNYLIKKLQNNDIDSSYIEGILERYHMTKVVQSPARCQVSIVYPSTSNTLLQNNFATNNKEAQIQRAEGVAIGHIQATVNFASSDFQRSTFGAKHPLKDVLEKAKNHDEKLLAILKYVKTLKDKDAEKIDFLSMLKELGSIDRKLIEVQSRIDSKKTSVTTASSKCTLK